MAIRIAIKDVMDFCFCPKYYDIKHENPNERSMRELYDTALHKIFYAYLRNLQQGSLEGCMKFLKKRWGEEWIKQRTNSEIVCTPSAAKRDKYDIKRKDGINAIIAFNDIMNQKQFPIIINKEYELAVSKNIILTGSYEYVREITKPDGRKVIQIMKFRVENNRFQVQSHMHHDLELTAMAMAFEQSFNVIDYELVYVDVHKEKVVTSIRTQKDFDMLKDTVRSVVLSLKNNLRCVSPDNKCFHCEYRNVCKLSLE